MNIALVSPSKNAYSETFIKEHKERLAGNIFYYYGGGLPVDLEGGLIINSRKRRILDIVKGHFRLNRFSLEEQALISSFRKNKINLVFAEYGFTGENIIPVCQVLNLPLIAHFHGYDASRVDVLQQNSHYKKLFSYASYIIVVSKKMKQDLINLGCPGEKLVYNVYGPREEFLEVNPKFSQPQFIAIGRFVDKKAPYYLILAFKKVVKKYPEARLIIAGDGELWKTCKNLVSYYGLKKNVLFPGVVSKNQYLNYLKESLAMVQHSITAEDGDSEGTPVAILEASAAGLPVISTKHAGIPDVITDGETGLLVHEHDVNGMAEKMMEVLRNRNIACELGAKGKQNIKENYTLGRHIETLNDLIKKAIVEKIKPYPDQFS